MEKIPGRDLEMTPIDGSPAEALADLKFAVENHKVFNNNYFRQLESAHPWDRESFDVHRANFFYRTQITREIIAHAAATASHVNDTHTVSQLAYILNEECGNGDPAQSHEMLLETTHNKFGERMFDLEPLPIHDAQHSNLITPETKIYRNHILELSSVTYQRALGVLWAIETHAEPMLSHCRNAFRATAAERQQLYYIDNLEVYFNVHLENDVETRHASDAYDCVERNTNVDGDVLEAAIGAIGVLEALGRFWDGLYLAPFA